MASYPAPWEWIGIHGVSECTAEALVAAANDSVTVDVDFAAVGGVMFQGFNGGRSFRGDSWYLAGNAPADTDRGLLEARLRDQLSSDEIWVTTHAEDEAIEAMFECTKLIRPELVCIELRDRADAIERLALPD